MQTGPLRHLLCNDKDFDNRCFTAFSELRTTESTTIGSAPTSAATQSYRHRKSPGSAATESQTPRQAGSTPRLHGTGKTGPKHALGHAGKAANAVRCRLRTPGLRGSKNRALREIAKKKQPPCGSCCDSK